MHFWRSGTAAYRCLCRKLHAHIAAAQGPQTVKVCLKIQMAAVQPALTHNTRCATLPIGCGKVQPRKAKGSCVAFFKIKPQVYGREQHTQSKVFISGIVHAHKTLGSRGLKGSGHIKCKGKPPRKPLVGHRQQTP